VFVPGVVYLAIGIGFYNVELESGPLLGLIFTLVGVVSLIRALVYWLTTELAVTTKRVIAKLGLIRRETIELNHSKVESFQVSQSVFGRIFNFGTVTVCGSGGNKAGIRSIRGPMEFRRQAMGASDQAQTVGA
jgi:uncharacterized membrane protein YdbT with pleckstrin-like domain